MQPEFCCSVSVVREIIGSMKLDAKNDSSVRRFEQWVSGELHGTNVQCSACGASVPRKEISDNGHTIWTEDERNAYPQVCGPVERHFGC